MINPTGKGRDMSENVEDTASNEEVAAKNQNTENAERDEAPVTEPVAPDALKPNQASVDAAQEDAQFRAENPNSPIMRDAREDVAGESFDYLKNVGTA